MIYPLPPITDVVGLYRTVRLLSQRLRLLAILALAGSIANTVLVTHSQSRAVSRVYEKVKETSFFIS